MVHLIKNLIAIQFQWTRMMLISRVTSSWHVANMYGWSHHDERNKVTVTDQQQVYFMLNTDDILLDVVVTRTIIKNEALCVSKKTCPIIRVIFFNNQLQ
jgi:hypothetical protein